MAGKLFLVSVGPGHWDLIPPKVKNTLSESESVVSYELYLSWIKPWIEGKKIHLFAMGQERERAQHAIDLARKGETVSLISSGDIGVYAMATVAFELMNETEDFETEVIPGITAANACASLLGAPLSHDFATLSLSDLLCPWEWIEHRARCIAQADLAVVFYNVQSKLRQEGVYKILQIMLKHKPAETWCGIIRNAFREDQKVTTIQLKDLPNQKFDMLTSIVIGNRFTKKKGKYIYTSRGYHGWGETDQIEKPELPNQAYWVFSGTSDGNELAQNIYEQHPVVVSCATTYGKEVLKNHHPEITSISGHQGIEARKNDLINSNAKAIVDATHPYAINMSQQLMDLSKQVEIPYIRFERPSNNPVNNGQTTTCDTVEEAIEQAILKGKNIFLSIGSKYLSELYNIEGATDKNWFIRLTPDPKKVQSVVDLGIPNQNICAMQGPFSYEFNLDLFKQWNIDCVITKDSGDMGGYTEKVRAAQELSIEVIVIKRPLIDYPVVFNKVQEVLDYIF